MKYFLLINKRSFQEKSYDNEILRIFEYNSLIFGFIGGNGHG